MGPRELIVLIAMLMSIVAISIDALLPALRPIGLDYALENQNLAQYVISLLFVGLAFGELFWGPLSDAWGRKKVLYLSVAIYLFGSLLCYFAPSFPVLLVGRLIQGFGVAGPYVTSVSIVRDKYAGREMARIMSVVMTIFILVPAIAPSLGQLVLKYGSWRDVFLLYISYAVIVSVWLFMRMEETLPKEKRITFTPTHLLHGAREVLTNRITGSYTICMGICFGSFLGYLNSSQQIFQDQFKVGEMFSIYFGGLALMLGAASLVNARLVERLGMVYLCRRAFFGIIVISALFLLLHLAVDITLTLFMLYAGAMFFAFGLVFGNLNAVAMEPMGHMAGIAAAITGAGSSLISIILGSIIGQLYNNSLVPMTCGFLVLSVVALAVIHWAEKGRVVHDKPI